MSSTYRGVCVFGINSRYGCTLDSIGSHHSFVDPFTKYWRVIVHILLRHNEEFSAQFKPGCLFISHNPFATVSLVCFVLFKVTQSCPTLCDPVDYSPPGSSIHGILQASILEWVTISFSRGSSQPLNSITLTSEWHPRGNY